MREVLRPGGGQTRRGFVAAVAATSLGGCLDLLGPRASERPKYDMPLQISNGDDQRHSVEITITGERSEPYAELSRELPPQRGVELHPFTDLEEAGEPEFQFHVRVDDGEEVVTTEKMDECHFTVSISITQDEDIHTGQVVC